MYKSQFQKIDPYDWFYAPGSPVCVCVRVRVCVCVCVCARACVLLFFSSQIFLRSAVMCWMFHVVYVSFVCWD